MCVIILVHVYHCSFDNFRLVMLCNVLFVCFQDGATVFAPIKLEERHLSDSAFSSSATGGLSPYHSGSDSGNSNLTSSFDGDLHPNDSVSLEHLEGATGGLLDDFLSGATKHSKRDRQKYSFYTGANAFKSDYTEDVKYPFKVSNI